MIAANNMGSPKRAKAKKQLANVDENIALKISELAVELSERELELREAANRGLALEVEKIKLAKEVEVERQKAETLRQETIRQELALLQREEGAWA